MCTSDPTHQQKLCQTEAYRHLQSVCESNSLTPPDPDHRYLCLMRKDHTHWATMPAEKMVVVGKAKDEKIFEFLWDRFGMCRECVTFNGGSG